ncbi:MAG: N-acetylmuramoyl-L-alanine amidase, partial [Solirubrobacterales bacterium]
GEEAAANAAEADRGAADRGAAHAPARFISPPVEAPHEFDLVGVAHEVRSLEIRVRDSGGEWSGWVEQSDGTPVYVDGADEAQVRAPFRPSGELHFVNVSGTAGGVGDRLLNGVRAGINRAFIAVATSAIAEAAAPQPSVTLRSSWGADVPGSACVPKGPPTHGEVRAGVIHHTVNANTYTAAEAPAIVLGICSFHIQANGWDDIGYNVLVDRYGTLYEGRAGGLANAVVGAHAQGFNSQTTSIASLGDHRAEAITPAARESIVAFLAWRLKLAGLKSVTKKTQLTSGGGSLNRHAAGTVTLPRILGHRDLGLTECPGGALAAEIDGIRSDVQRRIKGRARCHKPCRRCKRARNRRKRENACEQCKRCKRKAKAKAKKQKAKRRAARAGRYAR